MLCIELKRRGSAECIGCYVCAEVLGERETLILRYFVLSKSFTAISIFAPPPIMYRARACFFWPLRSVLNI